MKRILSYLTTAGLVGALAGGLYFTLDPELEAAEDSRVEALPMRVRVDEVRNSPDTETHRYFGRTRAADDVSPSFTLPGRLEERLVDVGDRLTEGDVIARIDTAPFYHNVRMADAQIDELEAQLDLVRTERERVTRLLDAEIGTTQDLDRLNADAERLEAGIAAARNQRSEARRLSGETELIAPRTGVVTEVYLEQGEYAQPGMPILRIAGETGAEVELDVPEGVAQQLRLGDSVNVLLPLAGGRSIAGTITDLSRAAADRGRLFPVVITLNGGSDVPPGSSVEVEFTVDRPSGLHVPIAAVVDPTGSGTAIYVIEGDSVRAVPVEVLDIDDDGITIRGAVALGDEVAITRLNLLADGHAVEVVR